MAEALKLKVDKTVFQDTLDKMQNILDRLNTEKDNLQLQLNTLNGETFNGTDVADAKELAQLELNQVIDCISKVTAQRDAIQEELDQVETSASTLKSDTNDIRNELPDLFK